MDNELNSISKNDKKIFFIMMIAFIIIGLLCLTLNDGRLENYIQFLLFYNLIFIFFSYVYFFKSVSYIDPSVLLILSMILYELPKVLWYLGFYNNNNYIEYSVLDSFLFRDVDYLSGSILYLLYTNICVVIIILFSILADNFFKVKDFNIYYPQKSIFYIYMTLGLIVIAVLLKESNFNILFLLSSRQGSLEAKNVKDGLYFFTLICFSLQVLFIRLITIETTFFKIYLSYTMFIVLCITSYLVTGSRGFSLYSILAVFIYNIQNNGYVNWKYLMSLSVVFVIIFSILGIMRNTDIDNISIESIVSSYDDNKTSSLSSYQFQLRDELIFDRSEQIEPYYLSFYLSPLTSVFPKIIIGDLKLPMIDGVLAKDIWGRYDIGLPVNSSTESFLSFKFFGSLCFIPFVFILKYLYYRVVIPNNLISIYLPLTILNQTYLSSKTFFSIQILIIVVIVLLISKFINYENK